MWIIREATRKDLNRLVGLAMALARATEGRTLDKVTVRAGVESLIDSSSQGFIIVAEDKHGRIVAELTVGGSEWSDWSNGRYWLVTSFAFEPSCNVEALTKALHQRLVELATAQGIIGIRCNVFEGNAWAASFFRSIGLTPNGYSVFEQKVTAC